MKYEKHPTVTDNIWIWKNKGLTPIINKGLTLTFQPL